MRLVKACASAAFLLVLIAGIPLLLTQLVGSPWPNGGWTSVQLMTDSAVLGLLAIVGWIAWAQLMACLATELAAEVRRVPVPNVGPRIQREMARSLIRAVLLVGATGTVAASAWQPVSADAASATPTVASPAAAQPSMRSVATASHLVESGDTLWGIAERRLGDGMRWRSIADLNHDRTMTDGTVFRSPGDLRPGWILNLPAPADREGQTVTVAAGDSLSAIARRELGAIDRWPEIYKENRGIVGDDPDLIEVGLRLAMPTSPREPHEPRSIEPPIEPPIDPPPHVEPSAVPSGEASERPVVPEPPEASGETPSSSDDDVPVTAVTPWRAVLATGSCLAVGLMGLVAANRRRQLAARRPGRLVRSSPPDLRPLERAIHEVGHDKEADVSFIDVGLRTLSRAMRDLRQPLPNLGAAVLSREGLILKLIGLADQEPPWPWTQQDDDAWFLDRTSEVDESAREHPAPYPALVSTGTDDAGQLWLLDLEAHGGAGLDLPSGLLRHWVTELAANPWGRSVELLVANPELHSLAIVNPERVRTIDWELASKRAAALRDDATGRFANLLELRRDGAVEDATGPVVLLGTIHDDDGGARGRDRVVFLAEGCRELLSAEDGQWSIVDWDVPIEPVGLDPQTFEAVASLLEDTENQDDVAGSCPNAATEIEPRDTDSWNEGSLLSAPDRAYLVAGDAITAEDLVRLAPKVSRNLLDESLTLDPDLDRDVADWHDPGCIRPKVKVLGPVDVRAVGGSRAGIRNVGGTIEFIVYLTFAERGVTKERAAEDLGWSGATVQNRARDARRLMGLRSDGTDWLPDAARSQAARNRGVPTYELLGEVLTDADLLRRLRARAQATGPEGEADVSAALRLVDGEPFDQLRKGGYGWLLEGDRHDLHLAAAIDDLRLIRRLRDSA